MSDNAFVKAEKVVRTSLGLLEREVVLPGLVWRDAGGDFRGAKNDTITIKLPAYSKARRRTLRSGTPRTKDNLQQRSVDVRLDVGLYNDIAITDEQLTLDVENYRPDVIQPVLAGLGRGLEDEVVTSMEGASYAVTVAFDVDSPYSSIVDCRTALNDARVPVSGRYLAVGSEIEARILKDEQFVHADKSGDQANSALREAIIGRIAGFQVVTVPGFHPQRAVAAHTTAFALAQRAPIVPDGAPWGASESWEGFAMRVVRVFDPDEVEDRAVFDTWCGVTTVTDYGAFNQVTGQFEPAAEYDPDIDTPVFVRAVELTLGSGS